MKLNNVKPFKIFNDKILHVLEWRDTVLPSSFLPSHGHAFGKMIVVDLVYYFSADNVWYAVAAARLLPGSHVSSHILQIHEKEEEEMNEKNDNANCLNEEPLITADQVCVWSNSSLSVSWFDNEKKEALCNMKPVSDTRRSGPFHLLSVVSVCNNVALVFFWSLFHSESADHKPSRQIWTF